MGHAEVAELLAETLDEEKAADAKLTELAESGINDAANNGMAPEEMLGERTSGRRAPRTNGRTSASRASR